MKLAQVLSDLSSLKVCDPNAALSLVSARPSAPGASNASSVEAVKARTDALLKARTGEAPFSRGEELQDADPDLQRAKDLVKLHYAVKVKHVNGGRIDEALEDARHAVQVAVGEMR